eukprot:GHVU01206543.1.p1 GENE.GHVU01206543.1~~GHVU01206543.1.p1  ORF type:complete len:672 (-),score=36.60 GHVU01206543.1:536-2551(-)
MISPSGRYDFGASSHGGVEEYGAQKRRLPISEADPRTGYQSPVKSLLSAKGLVIDPYRRLNDAVSTVASDGSPSNSVSRKPSMASLGKGLMKNTQKECSIMASPPPPGPGSLTLTPEPASLPFPSLPHGTGIKTPPTLVSKAESQRRRIPLLYGVDGLSGVDSLASAPAAQSQHKIENLRNQLAALSKSSSQFTDSGYEGVQAPFRPSSSTSERSGTSSIATDSDCTEESAEPNTTAPVNKLEDHPDSCSESNFTESGTEVSNPPNLQLVGTPIKVLQRRDTSCTESNHSGTGSEMTNPPNLQLVGTPIKMRPQHDSCCTDESILVSEGKTEISATPSPQLVGVPLNIHPTTPFARAHESITYHYNSNRLAAISSDVASSLPPLIQAHPRCTAASVSGPLFASGMQRCGGLSECDLPRHTAQEPMVSLRDIAMRKRQKLMAPKTVRDQGTSPIESGLEEMKNVMSLFGSRGVKSCGEVTTLGAVDEQITKDIMVTQNEADDVPVSVESSKPLVTLASLQQQLNMRGSSRNGGDGSPFDRLSSKQHSKTAPSPREDEASAPVSGTPLARLLPRRPRQKDAVGSPRLPETSQRLHTSEHVSQGAIILQRDISGDDRASCIAGGPPAAGGSRISPRRSSMFSPKAQEYLDNVGSLKEKLNAFKEQRTLTRSVRG